MTTRQLQDFRINAIYALRWHAYRVGDDTGLIDLYFKLYAGLTR